jgi:MoaA/NifB/PqqE/SkfB family radical SAM enzyme
MKYFSENKELTLNEIEKICQQLKPLIFVVMTGGEPFLRDNIAHICELFFNISNAEKISIPTNCISDDLIASRTEEILRRNRGRRLEVNLSIDGLAEVHDYMRGYKGNFERFLSTYRKLADLKRSFPNFKLNLQTVLCTYNKNNLDEFLGYIESELPKIDFHSFELLRGDPRDKEMQTLQADEYEDILPKLERYWRNFKGTKGLVRDFKIMSKEVELNILKKKRQVYPCYAGSISGVIEPAGDVRLCEPLDKIGNLRDHNLDFKKLWFSEKAESMRRSIKRGDCYCTHSCFVASSLAFSPSAYFSLLKNKAIAKRKEKQK